jgi:pimeloyl-ACP methyl ester carboxylesterase
MLFSRTTRHRFSQHASFAEAEGLDVSSDRRRVPVAAEEIAGGDIDGGLKSFVENINGQGTWPLIPQSVKQELRDNARILLGQIKDQRQPYRRAEAEAISLPTLFILGENTQGSLPVVLRALAAAVRGSKTAIIANAPHHMIRQEPVGTSNAVLVFLASDES